MLDLYKNIKKYRLEQGITQQDLAEKAGYKDKSMIAKIEKGLIDLPQSKIAVFADIFGITQSELMGWEDNAQEQLPPDIRSAARDMMELSEDDQKLAINMINSLARKGKEARKS